MCSVQYTPCPMQYVTGVVFTELTHFAAPDPLPRLSQEEMTSALATMRVDYDQVKIKDLDTSSNPLLNKRRKKAAAGAKSGSTVCQSQ